MYRNPIEKLGIFYFFHYENNVKKSYRIVFVIGNKSIVLIIYFYLERMSSSMRIIKNVVSEELVSKFKEVSGNIVTIHCENENFTLYL